MTGTNLVTLITLAEQKEIDNVKLCGMYILDTDGRTVIHPKSTQEWGKWFETEKRRVNETNIQKRGEGMIRVSTVFLGLDHRYGDGPLQIFETMIFGGRHDQDCRRCATWDEAEQQHQDAIAWINSNYDPDL